MDDMDDVDMAWTMDGMDGLAARATIPSIPSIVHSRPCAAGMSIPSIPGLLASPVPPGACGPVPARRLCRQLSLYRRGPPGCGFPAVGAGTAETRIAVSGALPE